MLIIPAIDIRGGQCVRLEQGRKERESVYSPSPLDVALRWEAEGASRLHVVDLDGAFAGEPRNLNWIGQMASQLGIPLQVGGGVRNMASLVAIFKAGASFVILGTAAIREPGLVRLACRDFPGQILLGVDVREGMVMVGGWEEGTGLGPRELVSRFTGCELAGVILTDISRDGTLRGANLKLTRELARELGQPLYASGGVASVEDIKRLLPLEAEGLAGVIVGKALYEGTLSLKEALELARCWLRG